VVSLAGAALRRPISGKLVQQRLTSREWEVFELLAQERSTVQIARRLGLSCSAVRAHITSVTRKLHVDDRAAAAGLFRKQPGG